jgi:uncharacterized protein
VKFQPDNLPGTNVITRQEPDRIWVGNEGGNLVYASSVLVPWQGPVLSWVEGGFDALQAAAFDRIAELAPEVVVFGSGSRLRFAHPSLMRGLLERRIGVETMDTAAACRTFNVLAAEGRQVLAALLLAA